MRDIGEVELCLLATMSTQSPCWVLHQPSTLPMNPAFNQTTHTQIPVYFTYIGLYFIHIKATISSLPALFQTESYLACKSVTNHVTKAMTTSSHVPCWYKAFQLKQLFLLVRTYYPLCITRREHTSLSIHGVRKSQNIKSENPRFKIWCSVVAPSGGREKNLNTGA